MYKRDNLNSAVFYYILLVTFFCNMLSCAKCFALATFVHDTFTLATFIDYMFALAVEGTTKGPKGDVSLHWHSGQWWKSPYKRYSQSLLNFARKS